MGEVRKGKKGKGAEGVGGKRAVVEKLFDTINLYIEKSFEAEN